MSSKDDSILYGAKRAGITWLFNFRDRKQFNQAQAAANRFGMSLGELMCRIHSDYTGAPKLRGAQKTFDYDDRKSSTLKIELVECDPLTRRCLERQAVLHECNSVEEYVRYAFFTQLEEDEEEALLDPRTGDAFLFGEQLEFRLKGCHVDNDAPQPPPPGICSQPVQIPAGTLVEQCDAADWWTKE